MEQIKKSNKKQIAAILASIVHATSYSVLAGRDVGVSLEWAKSRLGERRAGLYDNGNGIYAIYGTGTAIYLYTALAKAELDRVAAERVAAEGAHEF